MNKVKCLLNNDFVSLTIEEKCAIKELGRPKPVLTISQKEKVKGHMEGSNQILDLQEELSMAVIDIAKRRSEVPEQCGIYLHKNLKLQQRNAEKIIVMPKKNSKKLVCKYPLDKSVKSVFELNDEETVEEVASSIAQVREDQVNLLLVMAMIDGNKPNMYYSKQSY